MQLTPGNILTNPTILNIVADYREVLVEKEKNAWNIFNLSSYNNHLENFHSDIIASLLDPKGLHMEGNNLLFAFIDFINENYSLHIEKSEFLDARVPREQGRIDVGIFSDSYKKCVIIENKINNAPDQENQLERYKDYSIRHGYEVVAILYLSLDGLKTAPLIESQPALNIAAFNNRINLVSGWLESIRVNSKSEHTRSFVHQYIKLIKTIAHKAMETNIKKDFYNFVGVEKNRTSIENIITLYKSLTDFRRDYVKEHIGSHNPFKRSFYYQWGEGRDLGFNRLYHDNCEFQLDLWFNIDGSAFINFWIPIPEDIEVNIKIEKIKSFLNQMGLLNDFEVNERHMSKYFYLEQFDNNITNLDAELIRYSKIFFEKACDIIVPVN